MLIFAAAQSSGVGSQASGVRAVPLSITARSGSSGARGQGWGIRAVPLSIAAGTARQAAKPHRDGISYLAPSFDSSTPYLHRVQGLGMGVGGAAIHCSAMHPDPESWV